MSETANASISVEIGGGITTIRFDQPETQNALSIRMLGAIADALVVGERDGRVKAFVMTGVPGIFSSGASLREILNFADDGRVDESFGRFVKTLATLEKPLIAAVDGLAMGLGSSLLFHCDFVVASEWSSFESNAVEIGMVPDAGATLLAPRLMGHQRAFEFLVLGERFDAERAYHAGLVNRIVPAEDVETTAIAVAKKLAKRSMETAGLTRRLMRGERRDVLARIDQEAAANLDRLRSPLARDSIIAFMRKAQ
jgi:enoyl-CoA hydratase/carnithine racemase